MECKNKVISYLKKNNIDVVDTKLKNDPLDDYPDFAFDVCKNVLSNKGLGILICGTGIGMSIAANKVKGIYWARVTKEDDAFTSKNHNGANVIAFSAHLDFSEVEKIVDAFIGTKGPCEERHLRRLNKVIKKEQEEYNEI